MFGPEKVENKKMEEKCKERKSEKNSKIKKFKNIFLYSTFLYYIKMK